MNSGRTTAEPYPIRFADILFAEVRDPNGQNPKTRRVVVLTPDIELSAGFPIVHLGSCALSESQKARNNFL